MKYVSALIAVSDLERSKAFYTGLLGQKIVLDLVWNVVFEGGFCIQYRFADLMGLDPASVQYKAHNLELYFEVEDFDAFLETLAKQPDIIPVHPPKKYDWQQRVARIYDPDMHIIEIGESMAVIAKRFLAEGLSVEEIAAKIQHPIEFVKSVFLA